MLREVLRNQNKCRKAEHMRVLILNTSHNDLAMISALKKMGCYVIATGNRPGLPGEKYVDEYIQADYSDKEKMLSLSRQLKIDAVCACCNDFGVITASYIAEKLGLEGHDTYENTLTIHHKDRFKKFAAGHNIMTPPAWEFDSEEKAEYFLEYEMSYPGIVKPADLSAGNGVMRVENPEEGKTAVSRAFEKSRVKKIVIEPYIEGSQHAICTFLKDKKVVACCSNDEYSIVNPYRVEIDTYPAAGFEKVKDILVEQIEKIAEALQLKDGIFHMQYRMKEGRPYILEAMRRVLGNMYGIPASRSNGFAWDYWEARTHCGLDCSEVPFAMETKGFHAYRAIMSRKNGILRDVQIDASLEKYIFQRFMMWEKGQKIENFLSQPLGFLFFEFDSMEEMHQVMLEEYEKIAVILEE